MEIVPSFQTKSKFQTVVAEPYLANDPLAEPSSSASLVAPQVRIGGATAASLQGEERDQPAGPGGASRVRK
jgi:hypothetical protein